VKYSPVQLTGHACVMHLQMLVLSKASRAGQEAKMTKNPGIRRASAVIMAVLGAILMLLAPEVWPGALLLILGVVLELVGIALEHKAK